MTMTHQQIADRVKALTLFCLAHRGKCFEGWPAWKIFRFVAWHFLNQTLFVANEPNGEIGLIVIVWPNTARRIMFLDRNGQPQFDWQHLPLDGDAFVVADVLGNVKLLPDIWTQVSGEWPDTPRKRLFTYRRGKLKELTWTTVRRLTHGLISIHS